MPRPMNSPSPLSGGRPRRTPVRWVPRLVGLRILAGMGVWVVTLVTSSSGGNGQASAGRAATALERTSKNANPNSKLRGQLPVQAPPGISLTSPNALNVHLRPKPAAAVLFDMGTGRVLWQMHALRIRPIASVTKMMTALIVTERLRDDDTARITREALHFHGSEVGVLPRGRRVLVRTLLYGALLPSGNDAALVLADRVAGSDADFAKLMNARARQLGLSCTLYASSYGLQDGNKSCAADMASLARVVMRVPRIANVVRHEHVSLSFPCLMGGRLDLYSTNPLLRFGYRGTIGLKTGSTNAAGICLVAVVHRETHTLGVVLLHSPNIGAQVMQLFNAGFRALRGA